MKTWFRTGSILLSGLLAVLLVSGSQTHNTSDWQSVFNEFPRSHAYSASYYGVGKASHFLGELYWREGQRARALYFYQRAVEQGDGAAAYALSKHIPAQKDNWLKAAAELGDNEASLQVASQLIDDMPEDAYELLEPLAVSSQRNEMMASLLFNLPELNSQRHWQDFASSVSKWRRRQQVETQFEQNGYFSPAPLQQCEYKVALYFAASQAREAGYDWLSQFQGHPYANLGLCFVENSITEYSQYCAEDSMGRAHCQLTPEIREQTADFHLVISATGLANARQQQIFINQDASFEILVHEIAHWFSLADEYPMREPLASQFCSGRYDTVAQNLVVTSAGLLNAEDLAELQAKLPWALYLEQPIATAVENKDDYLFKLGSADQTKVGLFATNTCALTEQYQAWKPVATQTFMEQHEVGIIPPLYLNLMQAVN